VDWQADYLFHADLPPEPIQQDLVKRISEMNPEDAVIVIGFNSGFDDVYYSRPPYYTYPEDFEIDFDIARVKPADPEYGDDYDELDDETKSEITRREYILEDYEGYKKNQEERKAFEKFWPGFIKTNDLGTPSLRWLKSDINEGREEMPDFGWRVPLAVTLKKVPDKEKRIELLEKFIEAYREDAFK